MPFQSQAQAREMFANQPEIAKRWAALTPSIKSLPQHVRAGGAKDSTHQAAAKRLRKEALNRGNKHRQEVEGRAPKWKNEPSGTAITFVPHSNPIQLKRK